MPRGFKDRLLPEERGGVITQLAAGLGRAFGVKGGMPELALSGYVVPVALIDDYLDDRVLRSSDANGNFASIGDQFEIATVPDGERWSPRFFGVSVTGLGAPDFAHTRLGMTVEGASRIWIDLLSYGPGPLPSGYGAVWVEPVLAHWFGPGTSWYMQAGQDHVGGYAVAATMLALRRKA